ncbi:hypothetical protein Mpet_1588 [Methanolacinia petrolearia DSM 11571]|uniref:Uncharacterized protein n=1 Tax=Methanolacinia petrolearia (strain DSM 11571 / OCM 486 / SEBR 4847) TaxID=679926 RepID=E1RGQ0_METP4|nr:hypothetical protein [Methanolacinia petrolearia]ADN36345.1 hypothetical protein Mpet_1588 [Methanolacinia petrolearia DSM 11571]
MFTKLKNACILSLIINFCIKGFALTTHGKENDAKTGKNIKSQFVETKLKSAVESVLFSPVCGMQQIHCSMTADSFGLLFYFGSESAYSNYMRIYHRFMVIL